MLFCGGHEQNSAYRQLLLFFPIIDKAVDIFSLAGAPSYQGYVFLNGLWPLKIHFRLAFIFQQGVYQFLS